MTAPEIPDIPDAVRIRRLTRRAQFLAAAQGPACPSGGVVVQSLDRADADPAIGAGFTCTRKVGNSVVRNRARRRLREVARALLPLHGLPGRDYVFVARSGTVERSWDRLLDDVKTALIRLADPSWRPPAKRPSTPHVRGRKPAPSRDQTPKA